MLTLCGYLYPGGAGNRILGMARGIDRARIDQTIVMMQEETPELAARFGSLKAQFDAAGIPVRTLGARHPRGGESMNGLRRMIYSAAALRDNAAAVAHLVRELGIDVIDAHTGAAAFVGVLAGVATRTPAVITQYHTGKPAPVVLWPLVERINANVATRVITDSHARAADLQRLVYNGRTRVDVIPNGIEPPASALSREAARASFGFEQSDVVITEVARLLPFKGQWVLIEAARRVLDEFPRARFFIVGFARESDRGYTTELEERARVLGIADRVTIRGYDGPIGDVWQATDIHAHPSLWESLPNAIIEGMSLGKPAIVTSAGGMPEVVLNERTGLVVPPSDADALANAIVRYLRDPAFAAEMGAAAFARYTSGYRSDVIARRIEALLFEVARRA